jgi:hypothetical protein
MLVLTAPSTDRTPVPACCRQSTKEYQKKWMKLYGHDFGLSKSFAQAIYQ